ncbi:MAG TPA: hypothetical protein VEQ60_17210, partial [Longimicrobium sp.]|nr:hypothetical protein [Longimicrobium sp.]
MNAISKAERARDQLYDMLLAACEEEGVEAVVVKSPPYSAEVAVTLESWTGIDDAPAVTERAWLKIIVRPTDFHRFEHELDVEVHRGDWTRRYTSVKLLTPKQVQLLVTFVLGRVRSPRFSLERFREHPLQFWRDRNSITRLRTDWALLVAIILMIAGTMMMIAAFITYQESRDFYSYDPYGPQPGNGVGLGVVGLTSLMAGIALVMHRFRKPYFTLSSGRPLQEPRNLLRLDSWQALIYGLGVQAESLKTSIRAELERGRPQGFGLSDEHIWYWGVDGKEEREQIVVTFRRGIAFIHVYRYADDLYVAWDAHVNAGTWVEKSMAGGVERETGRRVQINTITGGWHVPNQYDITDTNCLVEWTHAAVTKVVKRFIAEHKIDQEIDFKILREERKGIEG